MTSKRRPVQPILGIVAPPMKQLTPSQRELARRAGTHLSIQQQQAARRRARAEERANGLAVPNDREVARNLADQGVTLPRLKRL